jgi:hypothetical protein
MKKMFGSKQNRKKASPKKNEYKVWDLSKGKLLSGGKRLHKQFFQDRVALVTHGGNPLASKVEWWFQSFNRATFKSYKETDLNQVAEWLRPLVKNANYNVAKGSLDFSTIKDNDKPTEKSAVRNRLKVLSIKNWILVTARDYLLEGIDDLSIKELVEDAVNDLE